MHLYTPHQWELHNINQLDPLWDLRIGPAHEAGLNVHGVKGGMHHPI